MLVYTKHARVSCTRACMLVYTKHERATTLLSLFAATKPGRSKATTLQGPKFASLEHLGNSKSETAEALSSDRALFCKTAPQN